MEARRVRWGLVFMTGAVLSAGGCGEGGGDDLVPPAETAAAALEDHGNERGADPHGDGEDEGDRGGDRTFVYVGSHDAGDPGTATGQIAVFRLDRRTGVLTLESAVLRDDQNLLDHPDFLAFDPRHRRLFAVSENFFDPTPFQSAVASFSIAPATGALTLLSARPTGFSFDPFEFTTGAVHLAIDRRGSHLLVAIFDAAVIQTYPVDAAGVLAAELPETSVGDRPHEIVLDHTGHTALVPCLGSDEIRQLAYDGVTGSLAPAAVPSVATPPGAGPRHLVFADDHRFVYLVDETAATVNVHRFDGGSLGATPLQSLTTLPSAPAPFDRHRAAEVALSPDGRHLYVSTRLDAADGTGGFTPLDGYLTVFRVDRRSGRLTETDAVRVGKEPRHFSIDPSGRILVVANQLSDNVVSYRLDRDSGRMTPAASAVISHPEFAGAVRLRDD